MKLAEDKTMNIIGTFHMVVKARKGVDLDEFLLKHNEYLAEPTNADGVVIVLRPKSFQLMQNGLKSTICEVQDKPKENVKQAHKKVERECRTCGSKTCGMLAGFCAKWEPIDC